MCPRVNRYVYYILRTYITWSWPNEALLYPLLFDTTKKLRSTHVKVTVLAVTMIVTTRMCAILMHSM